MKVDGDKRRIGLSLKRVASAEYADSDWLAFEAERSPEAETEAEAGTGDDA